MADIKINELATNDISLSDFFAKADSNGIATKNTIQGLSNFLNTQGSLTFRGKLLIADTPTLDGWYFAGESGTYTNAGGLVVSLADTLTIIIVADTQTTFEKVEIPLSIVVDAVPTENSINTIQSGGVYDFSEPSRYLVKSYKINESASSASVTSLNLLSTELFPPGFIKSIKLNIATIGNLKFACFRKLDTLKYKLIKQFDYNITSTGVQTITLDEEVDEDFYFGVVNGSTAQFNTESTDVGAPFNLHYFSGAFDDNSVWSEATGRTTNLEIVVLKSDFVDYVNSLIEDGKQTGVITNSYAYNASYSTASSSSLNLTTSEELPLGVVKKIKLDVVTAGVARFAFLRNEGTQQFRIIKYYNTYLDTGLQEIDVNEFIDEDFHFALLKDSITINTASGDVGDAVDLYFTSADFDETTTWSESTGRGHNIEIEIDTNPMNFPTKKTGLSICYCGDSITDFMDSTASDGKNYIGYDVHINRFLEFKEKTILGYSGIQLAQSGGFANTRVSLLPVADVYTIYLGTNDFALTTQTTLGTISDYFNNTGVNTYYGAFRVLIDAIYSENSRAKIILFTPSHRDYSSLNSWGDTNSNGNTLNDFANAVREIGNYNSLDVVDLFAECNLNLTTDINATYDNLHPNTFGYQLIAECFVQKMYNKL